MNEKINLNRFANSFLNASFKKKVVAGLLIIGVILSLGFAAWAGVNITLNLDVQARLDYLAVQQQLLNDTINIPVNSTVSAMMKTVSYIVSVHSTSYCLINGSDDRAGRLEYYNTNFTRVTNYALGNLSVGRLSPQVVQLWGSTFQVNGAIQMPSYSMLKGPAVLTAVASNNQDIITLRDVNDAVEIYIKDVDINGNRGSCTSGRGVYMAPSQNLVYTDWSCYRTITIENMKVRECDDEGVYINCDNAVNCGPVVLKDVYAHQCDLWGIHVENSTDTSLIRCYTAGCYLRHCTSSLVEDCYFGNINSGGITTSLTLGWVQRTRILGTKIDSPQGHGIVMEDGCTSVVMVDTEIKIGVQLSANDTYAGIEITSATYCIFGIVRVSQTSGTNVLKYSIEEVSPSNYNVFDDLILTGYTRYGLRTTGANSKYDSDAIIGSVITS